MGERVRETKEAKGRDPGRGLRGGRGVVRQAQRGRWVRRWRVVAAGSPSFDRLRAGFDRFRAGSLRTLGCRRGRLRGGLARNGGFSNGGYWRECARAGESVGVVMLRKSPGLGLEGFCSCLASAEHCHGNGDYDDYGNQDQDDGNRVFGRIGGSVNHLILRSIAHTLTHEACGRRRYDGTRQLLSPGEGLGRAFKVGGWD